MANTPFVEVDDHSGTAVPCDLMIDDWPATLQQPEGHVTTLPWLPTPLLLTLAAATEQYTPVTIPYVGKEIRQVFYVEDIPPRTLVVGHNPNGIVFTKSELMFFRELGAAGGKHTVFVLVRKHTFLLKCSFRFRNWMGAYYSTAFPSM